MEDKKEVIQGKDALPKKKRNYYIVLIISILLIINFAFYTCQRAKEGKREAFLKEMLKLKENRFKQDTAARHRLQRTKRNSRNAYDESDSILFKVK